MVLGVPIFKHITVETAEVQDRLTQGFRSATAVEKS